MSEEQNDSPAFRLRPRRAAPKSYYTVRLEYSANPAAFIRERPRSSAKRKVFTQKTGSNSTRTGSNHGNARSTIISKEDRDREDRRLLLHRNIKESITTDTIISPFMQRLRLEDLEPDSVYEHNYITLRIMAIEQSHPGKLLVCRCQSEDDSPINYSANVRLYNEYADTSLVKPQKIISIAKFRTGPATLADGEQSGSEGRSSISPAPASSISPMNGNAQPKSIQTAQIDNSEINKPCVGAKDEVGDDSPTIIDPVDTETESISSQSSSSISNITELPFHVIVKYDELVERSTSNSNKGPHAATSTSIGGSSVTRRHMIPFVSITDMIEQPTEPYVEMSSPTPTKLDPSCDNENHEAKKVKFTANLQV